MMRLGRLARAHNPRIPHFSALRLMAAPLPPPPEEVDYTIGLPANLGMMLNDRLGDCTCAAVYHALQVWTAQGAGSIDTEADPQVQQLYQESCGYNPGDASTDQGGVEQEVLEYLLNTGAPTAQGRHKIAAFVEVDPRNLDDIKRAIADCGVSYIGFNVPAYLMSSMPDVWDLQSTGDQAIVGGHAVVLAGYDPMGAKVISWGRTYTMTWPFFSAFTDEAYAIADELWLAKTGLTPMGMSLSMLEEQMQALRGDAS